MCFGSYSDGLTNPDGTPHSLTVLERFNSGVNLTNNEFETINQIMVSPNPSSGIFKIDLTNQTENFETLSVFNILGQNILIQKIVDKTENEIDLSSFANGIYFLRLQNSKETRKFKLVKQ